MGNGKLKIGNGKLKMGNGKLKIEFFSLPFYNVEYIFSAAIIDIHV